MCGGLATAARTSCARYGGQGALAGWAASHTLLYPRQYHSSWPVEEGVVLLGGGASLKTAEVARWDGSSEQLFALKYRTR